MFKYRCFILFNFLITILNISAQEIFTSVAPNFDNRSIIIPKGFKWQVVFSELDSIYTIDNKLTSVKGANDMISYIPIKNSNTHGYLYVSHEDRSPNPVIGGGGGASVMEIELIKNKWEIIGKKYAVNFSNVGETYRNCGGILTPKGTILSAEEEFPTSNIEIYERSGIKDTSDFDGHKRYENYGWMVEVDPITHKAIKKVKSFGRYRHEDAYCTADGKTVYLTCDDKPSILYKFECDKPNDYDHGVLYCYQQSMDGLSGKWNALPDDDYTKYNTQEIAIKNGATMFISVEWIEFVNNKLYISESGSNKFNFDVEIAQGAYPAKHLVDLCKKDSNVYKDPFGRILVMDLKTLEIKPLVNGGISKIDSFFCFSSPDALTSVQLNNKYYLVISEDTHGDKNGKASNYVVSKEETYNELYFLDLSIQNPTLEDLKRFMMAPEGGETTGDMFTPNGKTMFVSIQHPSSFNPPPFNRSCVVAIQGFK